MGGYDSHLNCLFITANVGSIFEDPEQTLKQWLQEFLKTVDKLSPSFIALHCQEVGGKNYEESMQHVEAFVKSLLSSELLSKYNRCRVYLDEDFTAEDKFTALGNLYFVYDGIKQAKLWNFFEEKFETLDDIEVLSGNIEDVQTKEKLKFPVNYFPDQKWSRKGYLRTRWEIEGQPFDLFNIHLFHDASNLQAMEQSPSQYSNYRRKAFDFVLDRVKNERLRPVPLFIFGDFNFRLDCRQLINKLTEKLAVHRTTNKKNGKLAKLQYKESDKVILTVESKCFEHNQHEDIFLLKSGIDLRTFDTESEPFRSELSEYPINFPPSYPFSEDAEDGKTYMKTRCPSWCDRILFNEAAKKIIVDNDKIAPKYDTIGQTVCMGDHKPVYLHVRLLLSQPVNDEDKGNNNVVTKSTHSSDLCSVNVVPHVKLHRKISINGDRISEGNLNNTSLLHNATFAIERDLSPNIMHKMSDTKGFRDVATYVMTAGRSLAAWLNIPSQLSSDEEDEDCNGNYNSSIAKADRPARRKRAISAPDCSVVPDVNQDSKDKRRKV